LKTPLLGTAYESRSEKLASQRLINLYPELVETQDGKEIGGLYGAPGLDVLVTVGTGPIRALRTNPARTKLYAVSGDAFYEIDLSWTATQKGTLFTGAGVVSMDRNATQMMVVDGTHGYIYTFSSGAFARITDADFPGADQVRFVDQYFAFNIPDTGQWGITALADGSSIDALDVVTSEGAPDNLIGVHVDHREVWTPGTESIEVWVPNPDDPDYPFARSQFIEVGCCSAATMLSLDNSVFWVDHDGIVRRAEASSPRRISTHSIERLLKPEAGDRIDDLFAFSQVIEGHAFYQLTSPTQEKTVVYDAAASAAMGFPVWHERAYRTSMNRLIRHRANCATTFNGYQVVGDFENGRIYAFNLDTFTDAGDTRKWLRSWRAIPKGTGPADTLFSGHLHVDVEVGVGLQSGQGSDPEMVLRVSYDGGKTWGNEVRRSMGPVGEYSKKVSFGPLSAGSDVVYELSGTDPVKVALVGAELEGELEKV
jgi:hypothetical protein